MAELADAGDSKSPGFTPMRVRVPPSAFDGSCFVASRKPAPDRSGGGLLFRLSGRIVPRMVRAARQMGEPQRTGVVEKNGKEIKTISFAYASVGGEPSESGVTPARVQAYFFHENILVGKEFISSYKSDSSNFDEAKTTVIKKGETTRSEVTKILGQPTAAYIPPMVDTSSGEAIGYAYTTVRGGPFTGFKTFTKILRISFDENGIVNDVELMTSGTK